MKRVLVTGATGFVGAHVVRALRARDVQVVALFRGDARAIEGTGVEVKKGDVLDGERVRDAASGCDGAIHCAGKVSRDAADAETLRRLHVAGTRSVLGACEAAGVARVVIASTSGTVAVSEDSEHVATEDDPTPYPIVNQWPYYRAKLWAEQEALARSRAGFDVMAVNPSLVLGPGDLRGSSTDDVRLFLDGKIAAIPSGGVSYVDARDAAEAMVLALERGRGGRRYLVGACNVTFRELFARLERVSGVKGPWATLPREATKAAGAILEKLASAVGREPLVDTESLELARHFWYLDASRAEHELGWKPRDPVTTLADTVADLRARGVVWPRGEQSQGAA
ncbi:MAG: NAD-dependent epimerase/dehydratase family protein [Polyangiaceae bacterium]